MPPVKGSKLIVGNDLARFHSKTRQDGDCIMWTSCVNKDGYGFFNTVRDGKQKTNYSHRWIFEQTNGPIPKGLHILHSCDRPGCVNVEHLRAGTNQENVKEAVDRGLTPRGEAHGRSTFTADLVREIRRRYDAGERQTQIGHALGRHVGTVGMIARRQRWRHIP